MINCPDRNSTVEKKWIGQSIRANKKLLPDYVRIDEKTLADFATFAAEYGKLISFFNVNNRPEGDWASFFRNDPTMCLLFLRSYDTEGLSARIMEMLHLLDKTSKNKENKTGTGKEKDPGKRSVQMAVLKTLVTLATSVFVEIQHVLTNISVYPDFREQLAKYIKNRLSNYFHIVAQTSYALHVEDKWTNPAAPDFADAFDKRYWGAIESYRFPEGDWIENTNRLIGQNVSKIIHDIEALKKEADVFLNNEVLTQGNIKPHIALFIAFCDLYQHAQRKLNNISERHLVHYFYEILGMAPMRGNSDSLYLTFTAAAGSGSLQLETGTLFNYFTTEEGIPVSFALQAPVAVHEGSIRQLTGISFSGDPWKGSFMKRSILPTYVYDLSDSYEKNEVIGFEISSQYLVLDEGDRRITFDFFMSRIESIQLKEKINHQFFDYSLEKLNELIANAWTCYYSTEQGMEQVERTGIQVSFRTGSDPDRLLLRFDVLVKRYSPPIMSPDPEDPAGDAVLRFALTPKGLEIYSLFRDISFSDPRLDLAVIGIKDLILQNESGAFKNEQPFEPFGPKPIIGSTLYIGHKNLFLKPLKELIINLEWYNLPDDRGGFKQYYKDYSGIESNSSFKVRLSHLKDKNWLPLENKQVLDLFTGLPIDNTYDNNTISLIRRMNEIDVQALSLHAGSRITGPLQEYDISTTDGFLRMELCYPEVCFGHDQYPELLQKEAFRSVKEKTEPRPINAPYTPSLKSISLEYKSRIEIGTWNDKVRFRKIHPFAAEEVSGGHLWSALPYFPEGGAFFVGLDPLLSGKEISLLFRISNQSNKRRAETVEGFTVSILDKTEWVALPPEKISGDSTKKFRQTGIIRLMLPAMQAAPHIYDGQSIWLRFDLKDLQSGNFIENIHLNAGLAIRDQYLQPDSKPVVANTITQLKDPVVQIELVEQPYPSFGGRNPESDNLFRFRVTERIRHKSRAVTTRDMEAMLLAQFPEIQSLKCLSHLNPQLHFQPGAVTVVVIPFEGEEPGMLERYFSQEQLMAMQQYLERQAVAGMKISVINPVYEKIRLKFFVQFRKGYDEKLSMKKLHKKIMDFLDPWKSAKIIHLGGAIPVTTILNAIELEEYVDFVTNFTVFHIVDGRITSINTSQQNAHIIRPKYRVSVLIPDNNHKLLSFKDQITSGINDMMVGNDFLIDSFTYGDSGLGFDALEKTFRLSAQSGPDRQNGDTFTLYLKE